MTEPQRRIQPDSVYAAARLKRLHAVELYVEHGLSIDALARLANCQQWLVRRFLAEAGVKIRPRGRPRKEDR